MEDDSTQMSTENATLEEDSEFSKEIEAYVLAERRPNSSTSAAVAVIGMSQVDADILQATLSLTQPVEGENNRLLDEEFKATEVFVTSSSSSSSGGRQASTLSTKASSHGPNHQPKPSRIQMAYIGELQKNIASAVKSNSRSSEYCQRTYFTPGESVNSSVHKNADKLLAE
jgi:hypothetical protein